MKGDSRFGDVSGGESAPGEKTVGEFSLSSLKLKLFLLSDSAPVGRRQKTPSRRRLKVTDQHGVSGASAVRSDCALVSSSAASVDSPICLSATSLAQRLQILRHSPSTGVALKLASH